MSERFTPSDLQAQAIREIKDWFLHRTAEQQVFRVFGFAGTGKTTITRHAIDELGLDTMTKDADGVASASDGVLYAAFTGKAALVMTRKGTPASTIHSLIYRVSEATPDEIERVKKEIAEIRAKLPTLDPAVRLFEESRLRSLEIRLDDIHKPRFVFNEQSLVRDAALIVLDEVSTPDLLFHPDLTYWDTRTGYPALIAIVRDAAGERIAIHRTYLAPDGLNKATVPKSRMMLGSVAGVAVRLGEIGASGVVGLGEGIETCLSVTQACPELPVWAGLASGNLEQVALPSDIKRVVVLADNDGEGAGLRAAQRAAERLGAEGRRVWIAHPPDAGEDFNDLLRRGGPERVREVVEAASEWQPESPQADSSPAADSQIGTHRPIGFRSPEPPLPLMRADAGDLTRLTDRSWSLLFAANAPPWLYRCGGGPAWVERDSDGRPAPRPMTEDRVRHALARLADWRRLSKNGDLVPTAPPALLLKNLLATPDPALPVLTGIVTAPVFGKDGTLITEPGYHPAARLLYEPPPGFQLAAVPERPTRADIAAARSLLLDDLLGDFPFVGDAERAHALALLLLAFMRPMISGPRRCT